MPSATYLPEARDDIDEAFVHYDSRVAGLGDQFLDELRRIIGLVESNPFLYGEFVDGVRAAPMRRFPYVVYYQERSGQVLIVAVRHGRGNPAIWQTRITPP